MASVGITGHQRLEQSKMWGWVEEVVRQELRTVPPPLIGVTSLAVGADQLFARLVLDLGGKIHAVLPYAGIERSFSASDLVTFRRLIADSEVEVLETPGTDEDAYLAAGCRVVELSDLLLAVWDGNPAKGKGGTADIVNHAKRLRVPLVHMNPVTRTCARFTWRAPD